MRRILLALLVCLLLCPCASAQGKTWISDMLSAFDQADAAAPAEGVREGDLALLMISGEISEDSYTYDHIGTLSAIEELEADASNGALLVVFNTPGGGIFEADELYHALMVYKERTGRPVYAYMRQECCSAGVLAAMAADKIMASRMSTTGSIGVYMQSFSEAGLLDILGVDEEYIVTGDMKVAGYPELTPEQRDVFQFMVDESFAFFKQAITDSRGLTQAQMEPFLDGRLLTAAQALEYGLIDEVLYYDEAVDGILDTLGQGAKIVDVTPEWTYEGGEDYLPGDLLQWLLP